MPPPPSPSHVFFPAAMFTIRGNELLLQTPVDFETDDYYQVMIESTDSGTPPLSHQVRYWQLVPRVSIDCYLPPV